MKLKKLMVVVLAVAAVARIHCFGQEAGASNAVVAQAAGYELVFAEGSQLGFEGDSTLHRYEVKSEKIIVDSEVEDLGADAMKDASLTVLSSAEKKPLIKKLVMTMPVEGLTSHIPGLAGTMYKALKYKDFPEIVFALSDYTVEKAAEAEAGASVKVAGTLGVAGATNKIDLVMSSKVDGDHVAVKGETKLLMSEFGVKPPTAMLGSIKAADEIIIKWDLAIKVLTRERSEEQAKPEEK